MVFLNTDNNDTKERFCWAFSEMSRKYAADEKREKF